MNEVNFHNFYALFDFHDLITTLINDSRKHLYSGFAEKIMAASLKCWFILDDLFYF